MNWVWPMAPAQEPRMCVGGDVAGLEDAEGGEELLLGQVAAAALVGEGGEALDHRHRAAVGAVVGLHAPDRQHHLGGRRRSGARWRPGRGELGALGAAGLDAGGGGGAVEVFPDRLGELGLAAVEAAPPRR